MNQNKNRSRCNANPKGEEMSKNNVVIKNSTQSDNMWEGAINIIGGFNTHYDPKHIGKEYAILDHGTASDKPGYLSISTPWFKIFAPSVDVVYNGDRHYIDLRVQASDNIYDAFKIVLFKSSSFTIASILA